MIQIELNKKREDVINIIQGDIIIATVDKEDGMVKFNDHPISIKVLDIIKQKVQILIDSKK